jgi:hypothetical protein
MTPRLAKRARAVLRAPRREGCTRDTIRCDFWNWGPEALRPQCCTDHLLALTVFMHDLLDRHGIMHWVDWGTLLGAVREQSFIAWDPDVDFGALETDIPRILALEPEIAAAGHAVDVASDPAVVRINYSNINKAHLDLFRWKEAGGELHSDFSQYYEWPGLHDRASFPKRYLERLEPVYLYGRPFPAPSPAHEFLIDHRFGPDYMVPMRSAGSVWLYPDLEPEDMTPAVKRLLSALAQRDARLAELTFRSRLSRTRAWEAWCNAARPLAPSPDLLRRARDGIPATERSEKVEDLLYAIACFDQAIDELQRPRPADPLRRAYRRAVRGGQAVKAKLTRTPRPMFGQR